MGLCGEECEAGAEVGLCGECGCVVGMCVDTRDEEEEGGPAGRCVEAGGSHLVQGILQCNYYCANLEGEGPGRMVYGGVHGLGVGFQFAGNYVPRPVQRRYPFSQRFYGGNTGIYRVCFSGSSRSLQVQSILGDGRIYIVLFLFGSQILGFLYLS